MGAGFITASDPGRLALLLAVACAGNLPISSLTLESYASTHTLSLSLSHTQIPGWKASSDIEQAHILPQLTPLSSQSHESM